MPKKSHRIIHRRARVHRRRAEPTAPHSILATLFGAAAAIEAVSGAPIGNAMNAINDAQAGDQAGATYYATQAVEAIPATVVSNLLPMIGLAAAAVVTGWAGRKYGKSYTNVSRKWRVV